MWQEIIPVFKPFTPSVSAAHVLTWEWIRKPDGRISCQDEGWVIFYAHVTSCSLLYSKFSFFWWFLLFQASLASHGSVLVTSMRWETQGQAHRHWFLTKSPCLLLHMNCFWPLLGPNALRAATLEATRTRGSEQQADMGQRRVYILASCHRAAVNQGNDISF